MPGVGDIGGRCDVTAFVRLLSFHPAEVGTVTDQYVREVMVPGLRGQPEVRHVYAGRAGPDDVGERMVASVWDLAADGDEAPVEISGRLAFEAGEAITEVTIEVYPLILSLPFDLADEARILRVFRGQARPGELPMYVEEARDGTYADVAARHGPAALFLGVGKPDRFITVSVWAAWENIAAATGGNLRQPMATRHARRLESGIATHYEIVPNTIETGEASG
jgi:hypothetical protein